MFKVELIPKLFSRGIYGICRVRVTFRPNLALYKNVWLSSLFDSSTQKSIVSTLLLTFFGFFRSFRLSDEFPESPLASFCFEQTYKQNYWGIILSYQHFGAMESFNSIRLKIKFSSLWFSEAYTLSDWLWKDVLDEESTSFGRF